MELAQHIMVHSLALIDNGYDVNKVKKIFDEGIEFCKQVAVDILQLSVKPKSKYPTHFKNGFYATFGYEGEKIVLKDYYYDKDLEINKFIPIDFDEIFIYNKDIDLNLLKYI